MDRRNSNCRAHRNRRRRIGRYSLLPLAASATRPRLELAMIGSYVRITFLLAGLLLCGYLLFDAARDALNTMPTWSAIAVGIAGGIFAIALSQWRGSPMESAEQTDDAPFIQLTDEAISRIAGNVDYRCYRADFKQSPVSAAISALMEERQHARVAEADSRISKTASSRSDAAPDNGCYVPTVDAC
jgi:hypothetical protein